MGLGISDWCSWVGTDVDRDCRRMVVDDVMGMWNEDTPLTMATSKRDG